MFDSASAENHVRRLALWRRRIIDSRFSVISKTTVSHAAAEKWLLIEPG
jgi:hypothetical protein